MITAKKILIEFLSFLLRHQRKLIEQLNNEVIQVSNVNRGARPVTDPRRPRPRCDSNDCALLPPDPVTIRTYGSSHLGRVADDYFSRDPVSDTVSVREQPLKAAVWRRSLVCKPAASLCWWNMLCHVPVRRNWDVGKSTRGTTTRKKKCLWVRSQILKNMLWFPNVVI